MGATKLQVEGAGPDAGSQQPTLGCQRQGPDAISRRTATDGHEPVLDIRPGRRVLQRFAECDERSAGYAPEGISIREFEVKPTANCLSAKPGRRQRRSTGFGAGPDDHSPGPATNDRDSAGATNRGVRSHLQPDRRIWSSCSGLSRVLDRSDDCNWRGFLWRWYCRGRRNEWRMLRMGMEFMGLRLA